MNNFLETMKKYLIWSWGFCIGLIIATVILFVITVGKNSTTIFDHFFAKALGIDKPISEMSETTESSDETQQLTEIDASEPVVVDVESASFWFGEKRSSISEVVENLNEANGGVVFATVDIPNKDWAYNRTDALIFFSKDVMQPEYTEIQSGLGVLKLPMSYSTYSADEEDDYFE